MKAKAILLVLMISFFAGCAAKNEMLADQADFDQTAANPAGQAVPSPDLYSTGSGKIIKSARYRFQVEDVQRSVAAIEAAVRKYPSHISSSEMTLENPLLEYKMTIRVQSEFFQDMLREIDGQATYFNEKSVETEDVAKQFVDLESRLKTKREVEARYMEILRKNAGTVEQLLEAEKQIGALHEEIEATISRINFLKEEVRYSTIHLSFYQMVETNVARTADSKSTTTRFSDAFRAGWEGVVGIAVGLLYLWPVVLLLLTIFAIYRFRSRRRIVV